MMTDDPWVDELLAAANLAPDVPLSSVWGRCARKVAYAEWCEAEAVARSIAQQELGGLDGLLTPYRCEIDLSHWHLSHTNTAVAYRRCGCKR